MNEINFLPDTFRRRQQRRDRALRHVVLIVLVSAGLAGLYLSRRGVTSELEGQLAQIQGQSQTVGSQKRQAQDLRQQMTQLQQKQAIQQRLVQPITRATLLATLTELIEPSAVITQITMSQDRPSDETPFKPNRGRGGAKPAKSKPVQLPQFVSVEMHGLAASGVAVANLIGLLEEHPLFERVEMKDSRRHQVEDLITQKFQLAMRVPLLCDYRPQSEAPQQHAAVGDSGGRGGAQSIGEAPLVD